MIKNYASLLLLGLIINLSLSIFVRAQDADAKMAAKQKIKISKIGVGGKVIDVRMKDKTKAKGYITEIKDDYFVLVDKKSAVSTRISYD